jgi:hypothetical protein
MSQNSDALKHDGIPRRVRSLIDTAEVKAAL